MLEREAHCESIPDHRRTLPARPEWSGAVGQNQPDAARTGARQKEAGPDDWPRPSLEDSVSAIVGARLVRPVSPAVARRALVVCTVHGGRQQLGRSTPLPPALDRIGSSPPESSSPGPSRRSELAGSGDGMAVRTTGCASASRGTPRDFGRIAEGSQRRSVRRRSSRFASFQQERWRLATATAQRICRAVCPMRPCRCGLTRPPAPWLHAARLRFRPHRSGQETLHGDGLQPRRRSAAAGRLLPSDPGLLLPCPRWLARRERCRTSALVARSLLLP
jgi:hypothetical protein